MADIRTNTTNTVEDNISCIYGQSVARYIYTHMICHKRAGRVKRGVVWICYL